MWQWQANWSFTVSQLLTVCSQCSNRLASSMRSELKLTGHWHVTFCDSIRSVCKLVSCHSVTFITTMKSALQMTCQQCIYMLTIPPVNYERTVTESYTHNYHLQHIVCYCKGYMREYMLWINSTRYKQKTDLPVSCAVTALCQYATLCQYTDFSQQCHIKWQYGVRTQTIFTRCMNSMSWSDLKMTCRSGHVEYYEISIQIDLPQCHTLKGRNST